MQMHFQGWIQVRSFPFNSTNIEIMILTESSNTNYKKNQMDCPDIPLQDVT